MYAEGQSVPQNEALAANWFRKAANQADARAQSTKATFANPHVPRGQGREPSSYSSSSRCFMNFARSSPSRVLSAIVFQTTLASLAEIGSSAGRRLKTRS
jgi:TPR repeat protein